MRAGRRLACPECTAELVVVRAPSIAVVLTCGGVPMVEVNAARTDSRHTETTGDGTLLGKRYADEESGLELLCTKPGNGPLAADGRSVPPKSAKPLPSSD